MVKPITGVRTVIGSREVNVCLADGMFAQMLRRNLVLDLSVTFGKLEFSPAGLLA